MATVIESNGTNGTTNGHTNGHKSLDWSKFYNIINGKCESTKQTRHSINPANGEANPEVPVTTPEDVDKAMDAAKRAFPAWSQTPVEERRKLILAYADAVEAEIDNFAKMLTQEQGKPLQFATMECNLAVHWIRELAKLDLPSTKIDAEDKEILVRYTPLGVCVGIVPWNFPILLAAGKIASALITGNTLIIKPSPFTPAGDLKLCEIGQQFFPPGVFSCLSGDDNLGPWLTAHPVPAKISFTGSSATGKKVMESASKTLKRVTLELGGKDPAIITDDVDVETVAPKIAQLAFMNSGQICIALKRIFVHESIYEPFLAKMVEATKEIKMGAGTEEGVFMGPIQNKMQFDKVKTFFDDVEKQGQKVVVGGKSENPDGPGYFITPTIIDRPDENSKIVIEEPFGPILPVMSYRTDEEAIVKANNTIYGLGASVWCRNLDRGNKIARQLEAGNVWVNTHFELDPRAPFGGHKESGMGHEWGVSGLLTYCNSQTLFIKAA